jgi:pimeloyl-ACP methyl ester carboxylesterase
VSDPAVPDPAAALAALDRPVHRAELPGRGLSLAYWHEGSGGYPLVLLHGYPETKRIWARCVAPLVAAGFEVIVPDLRGYGDSDLAPDGHYDPAAYGRDVVALVRDVLGHERCGIAAGDVGGAVMYDLAARFPGFVERQAIFDTVAPMFEDRYAAAGIPPERAPWPVSDYAERQGSDADGLLAELASPLLRRAYVAGMYTHRLWARPGTFSPAEVDWHTEPFADAERLRAAVAVYELGYGKRPMSEMPAMLEPSPVETLILYGDDDHVVERSFMDRCAIAFPVHVGPFIVPKAGHFLQWENPHALCSALVGLFRDRIAPS